MKKFSCIVYLLLILVFSCSYKFPDKTPDWKELNSYLPEKLEFQRTSIEEFKKFTPGVKVHKLEGDIELINTTPENQDVFREINAGFRNKTLDWVEFILNEKIDMKKFVDIYGFPGVIDTQYSKIMDYYHYETFNISTDKNHDLAQSITIFNILIPNDNLIFPPCPLEKVGFFKKFHDLKPGVITEEIFIKNYPNLLPYMEDDFDTNSCYTLIEELGDTKNLYKKAFLKFENGLLSWISLVPVNPDLQTMLTTINETYKIEEIDKNYDFYTFNNFVLIVNRETKKINNIGIANYDERF